MKIKKYNESIKDLMKPISEEDIDGKLDKIYNSTLKVKNDRVNTIYNIVNFLDNEGYTDYGDDYDFSSISEKILLEVEEKEFKKAVLSILKNMIIGN
jgi:hypothetical protein